MPKPFKFEFMWISHPDTSHVISEAWNGKPQFEARLKNTKIALKDWNKNVFGNVQNNIRQLKTLIQTYQEMPQECKILNAEQAAQRTLDMLLKREEQMWRDNAKARCIDEGDANTRFFHLSTVIHRRHNEISCLKTHDNKWIRSRQQIGSAFQQYFTELFTSAEPQYPDNLEHLINSTITREQNEELIQIPS